MVEDGRKENDNEVSAGGTLKMFIVVGICVCVCALSSLGRVA